MSIDRHDWPLSDKNLFSGIKTDKPLQREFGQEAPALVARSLDYAAGERQQAHSHERIQLMYSPCGIMRVTMEEGAWTLAPMRALWIPAGTTHEVRMVGAVSMRSVFIERDAAPWLWRESCLLPVTPLMRELILMLNEKAQLASHELASRLLLNLLEQSPRQLAHVPMPQDRRLRRVCEALLQIPGNDDPLDIWGERIGASARTLARRMKEETGMTFHQWRLQVRADEAVCRLAEGFPVADVARHLGYRSTSAFVYMFRSLTGATPTAYLDQALLGSRAAAIA